MNEQLSQKVAESKERKAQALKEVQLQRSKALTPRREGRPTLEEDSLAIKEHLDKPKNHRKEALKLFDEVITANSADVFKKLLKKAMDDDDNQQMAALKLLTDRLAPLAKFDDTGANGSNSGKVVINIAGLSNNSDVSVQGRVIDAEDVDVG